MGKIILINADINLDRVDGASIWLCNLINDYIKDDKKVILISGYPINNNNNLRNISDINKLALIKPNKILNGDEIKKEIEKQNNSLVEKIIIRNNILLDKINKNWRLLNKTTIYALDIHLNNAFKLENKFDKIWVQSEELKNLYLNNKVNVEKIEITPPKAYEYKFDFPERNDDEIRLIYTGTLRDEENILEIIEEFKKIHAERPEVLLTICYGKIHGDKEFTDKINQIIKEGVKGITFKYNLSHKDCCYEIAKSDIGICWRKNGWGDNGEVSTKVKEYEKYKIKILINNFDINCKSDTLYFDTNFYYLIKNFSKKILFNDNQNNILYLANTSFPQISGYTVRTANILNVVNDKYKVICFVKPNFKNNFTKIFYKNNIIYYHYSDIKNYKNFLIKYLEINKNIKIIWSASDNFNGILGGEIKNFLKLKSIYEIRGFWHYTRKYFEEKQNNFNETFFKNYNNLEKKACELNDYILCENNTILNKCEKEFKISKNKLGLLQNGVFENNIINKKDLNCLNNITFGYIGSIVSYEGILEFIEKFKKIDNKYNINFLIIGGGKTEDAKKTIINLKNKIMNINNIKYLGIIPHDEIAKYYDKIDIICLPRINCEVCNMVTPLKPYEAMMNGKIVFASSVDAISEIIKHGENGILFDKKNFSTINDEIINIINKKYDLNLILKNGYDFCKNNTWEKVCINAFNFIEKYF